MTKRTQNQQSLKEVIEQFFNQSSSLRDGHIRHKILAQWKLMVGEHISSKTTDVWYSEKTLFVSINSATLKNELSFRKKELAQKINEQLNSDAIREIIFR